MNYGIPYMGSKSGIALNIIKFLPSGERLVDLFGGGFAITHCAMLSKKWKRFLYNDFNPLVVELVKKAYNGDYNYNKFKPKFITHEEFYEKKETDGYIKYVWSFSNQGRSYLFGKDIVPIKHYAHDLVIFGYCDPKLEEMFQGISRAVTGETPNARRLQLKQWVKKQKNKRIDIQQLQQLQQLERLERLEQLEQLQRLERLQKPIEFTNKSYAEYEYQQGDIVYLDPPYENTTKYSGGFNHQEFYDWVFTRPYQVWFSSYKISDKRFKMVWAKMKRSLANGTKTTSYNFECIYTNK